MKPNIAKILLLCSSIGSCVITEESPETEFEVFIQQEDFPDHELRVREVKDLNVDNVTQYSGYLDVKNKQDHLFYWFFESRNDPKNDPTVFWINGGPGCSSLEGFFFENGPSSINSNLNVSHNPHSWNNKANVVLVDQPINSGFSYSSHSVSTRVSDAKDMAVFLELFFRKFPSYSKNGFHISGESYAGHYIPVLASEVLQTSSAVRSFNLTSVLIGNGLVDPLIQYRYYQPMACGQGGHNAVLSSSACSAMEQSIDSCIDSIQKCYDRPNERGACKLASLQCQQSQIGPYQQYGLNFYDVRTRCESGINGLCYRSLDNIKSFLNQNHVKKSLGVDLQVNYDLCSDQINRQFNLNGDWIQPIQKHVTNLLDTKLPVLIYAGDKDYICNWLGIQAWTRELPWDGHAEFQNTKPKIWNTNSGKSGEITNYEHFTFLRLYNAGHLVSYDQPANTLSMFNSWISGDHNFSESNQEL